MYKILIIIIILFGLNLILFNKEKFTENKNHDLTIVTAYFKVNRTSCISSSQARTTDYTSTISVYSAYLLN